MSDPTEGSVRIEAAWVLDDARKEWLTALPDSPPGRPSEGQAEVAALLVHGNEFGVLVTPEGHLRPPPALAAAEPPPTPPERPEDLARRFHETYERLAPDYGYETREASAVPWDEVPENSRALMVAVAAEILGPPPTLGAPEAEGIVWLDGERWRVERTADWVDPICRCTIHPSHWTHPKGLLPEASSPPHDPYHRPVACSAETCPCMEHRYRLVPAPLTPEDPPEEKP